MLQTSANRLSVQFSLADQSLNDPQKRASNTGKRDVDLLPLRRVLTSSGKLRDSLILSNELTPVDHCVVLRIKYVALDFTRDFKGECHIVPGQRFIGRITSQYNTVDMSNQLRPQDKFMVFPYSTCWIQKATKMCKNCVFNLGSDIGTYETHRHAACTSDLIYGESLDGGLQDYIRVPSPAHSLVKIPESVSLHDACFLFDVALPLLSYFVDVFGHLSKNAPLGRVLLLLDDVSTQSNDCLLVIRHLQLDQSVFTFTDSKLLAEDAGLGPKYRSKFPHVLVFSTAENAANQAVAYGMCTGLTLESTKSTLAFFRDQKLSYESPYDRKVYRPKLSYKDKFLLEDLLVTLDSLNTGVSEEFTDLQPEAPTGRTQTAESSARSSLSESGNAIEIPGKSNSGFPASSIAGKNSRSHSPKKRHVSWLHCESDFRLCSADNCVHDPSRICHQTSDINEMIMANSPVKRAFYTHRSMCHVELNAFIF